MQYPEKMHVSNLAIKFLDTYGCLKNFTTHSKFPLHTLIALYDYTLLILVHIWIRVGKTGSLGPCSRVIVYCNKLSFCQNDPPMESAKVQWYNANNLSKIKTKKCQIVKLSYFHIIGPTLIRQTHCHQGKIFYWNTIYYDQLFIIWCISSWKKLKKMSSTLC